MREWKDVFRQLRQLARPLDLQMNEPKADPDGIHKSLLAGLLSHIGLKDAQKKDYVGARQARFVVFPGSALAKKQPDAIMSAEPRGDQPPVRAHQRGHRPGVGRAHRGLLVKRTHSEPHWEKKQGATVAWERVTLYGVPIVLKRRVQFSCIDPAYARGSSSGTRSSRATGSRSRRSTAPTGSSARSLAEVEERTRRRDILNDDEAVFEFYDKRIPRDVASTRAFEGWWKKQRQETPEPPHHDRRGASSRRTRWTSTRPRSRPPGSRATSASPSPTASSRARPTTA
ncbi:DUF3418 domain-containing protein [Clavibacter tessellarius]|uniref:DUF3418 domain-containing protein n=1 Tax=Clavibacter tessellarius TaxID=31965 RepID=UPI0032565268